MPKVSIGMPVYNDVEFLPSALNSILSQSFEDFELIVSDDCSTDGSENVCLEYAKLDVRIKYIRQNNNLGISKNMMFLLNQAEGEYFMWAGNDDMWHNEFIIELLNVLEKKKHCVVAFCSYVDIDENNKHISGIKKINYSFENISERLIKLIKKQNDAFGYGLFRKDDIKEVKFPVWFWINKKCAYDNIFPTLCYYLTKGNFCFASTEQVLWYNRIKSQKHINHTIPYSNSFLLAYFSFALRKLNLVYLSALNIYRGSTDIKLVIKVFPRLFYSWFIIPVFYLMHKKHKAYKMEGPKIFI